MTPDGHPGRRKKRQRGLTLVELMVAMFLAILLTGGLFYMMSGQHKTYTGQLHAMTSNENLWGAMEYLQSQIWKGGYGFSGCPPASTLGIHVPVVYKWNGVAGCASNCVVPDSSLIAFTMQNNHNSFLGLSGSGSNGPDSFSVAYADDGGDIISAVRTTARLPEATTSTISVNGPGGPAIGTPNTIQINDRLVIWQTGSSRACLAVVASSIPSGGPPTWTIEYYPRGFNYNPPKGLHGAIFPVSGYAIRTLVLPIGQATQRTRHYFSIDSNPDQAGAGGTLRIPKLVTWTQDSTGKKHDLQIIAEGIEDMQLSWACDVNNDGALDEGTTPSGRKTDEWAFNVPNDTVPDCDYSIPHVIEAIRITLIARTAQHSENRTGYRPAAEDRAAGTKATDLGLTGGLGTFGRAVLTYTIKPRNIRKSVL